MPKKPGYRYDRGRSRSIEPDTVLQKRYLRLCLFALCLFGTILAVIIILVILVQPRTIDEQMEIDRNVTSIFICGGRELNDSKNFVKNCEFFYPDKPVYWDFSWIPTPLARWFHSAGVVNEKVMFAGGQGKDNRTLKSSVIFNPFSHKFTEGPPLNQGRLKAASATLNNTLLLCGGFNGHTLLNSCEFLDSSLNSWRLTLPIPEPRAEASMVQLNGHIYFLGGVSSSNISNSVYRFDPNLKRWTHAAPMIFPRKDFGASPFYGKIMVCGWTDPCEIYNPITDQWSKMMTNNSYGRKSLNLINFRENLFVLKEWKVESFQSKLNFSENFMHQRIGFSAVVL